MKRRNKRDERVTYLLLRRKSAKKIFSGFFFAAAKVESVTAMIFVHINSSPRSSPI